MENGTFSIPDRGKKKTQNSSNKREYKRLRHVINREENEAKEEWITKMYEEVDEYSVEIQYVTMLRNFLTVIPNTQKRTTLRKRIT